MTSTTRHLENLLYLAVALACSALILASCGKTDRQDPAPISTRETENTRDAIREYEQQNTAVQKSEVERAFAELDQEIHELEIRVERTSGEAKAEAQDKLNRLNERKQDLKNDYTEAKFQALLNDIKNAVR